MRLSQTDLKVLAETGRCEIKTQFPAGALFTYQLSLHNGAALDAMMIDDGIELRFPKSEFDNWHNTDKVGLENRIALQDGGELHLLVEKDWQCMTPRSEDESDLFVNPNARKTAQ